MTKYSDSPIVTREQDKFGYAPLAETIAKAVWSRQHFSEGLVIGLEASWGMGKTSAANLVAAALQNLNSEEPEATKRTHTVRFSPWLFSTFENLTVSYLNELSAGLEHSFGHLITRDLQTLLKSIKRKMGRVAGPSAGAITAYWAPSLFTPVSNAVSKLFSIKKESAEQLAKKLREKLRKIDSGQLVVIIDDLDRLHPDEVRQVLTLVKTFGDLPRVVHILLYDRRIVDAALAASLGTEQGEGPTFIEKIVQLPITLPTLDNLRLRDLFLDYIKQASDNVPFDEQEFRDLWRDHLRDLLVTPREVVRVSNAISVAWPGISQHAYPTDFAAIETLRVVSPSLYIKIRDIRRDLVDDPDRIRAYGWKKPTADNLVLECPADQKQALIGLLGYLFPSLSETRRDTGLLRGRRAIGTREFVDVYFRFQPGSFIGRGQVDQLIRSMDQPGWDQHILAAGHGSADLRFALSQLSDRLDEVTDYPSALHNLLDVGDRILGRRVAIPPALHDIKLLGELEDVAWGLARKIPKENRAEAIRSAIAKANSLTIPAVLWLRIGQRAPYFPDTQSGTERLLEADEFHDIGYRLSRKLEKQSTDALAHAPMLGWLLRIWAMTGNTRLAEEATRALLKDGAGFVGIVDGIMGYSTTGEGSFRRYVTEKVFGTSVKRLKDLARAELKVVALRDDRSEEERAIVGAILEAFLVADERIPEPQTKPLKGFADEINESLESAGDDADPI